MTKNENPTEVKIANTGPVEIKIDGHPYSVDPAVRDMLATATQVRDILANAIVEWSNGYYIPTKEEGKEEFHWTELKLKELVDKLIDENPTTGPRPTPKTESDKD